MTSKIHDNSHTNPQQLHIPRNRLPYILCRKTTGSFPSSKPVEIRKSSEFRKYPNTTSPWITSWVNPSYLQITHLQVVFVSFASNKIVHFLLSIESRVLIYKMILKYRHGVYLYGCFLKWWYPQNTSKWSFLVWKTNGCWKPTILGNTHFC